MPNLTKRSHFLKIAITLLLSLSSFGVVGGSFFLRKAFSNSNSPDIINAVSEYHQIRENLRANNYPRKHFPSQIPADAEDVNLAYSPSTAMGNSFLQVKWKQSPEKLKNLHLQYRKIAKHKYKGGNTNDHANLSDGVPTTFFYTNNAAASFPSDYEILVLDAQDRGSSGFKWSHGESYGVAINDSATEIVYWWEKW
ncbi:hypothetical protein [Fortiea contorta]|uniref:hypothetical protein n=1 Tax=Fortiea contorta TaxID=1892405 RepID=UPI000378EE0F|nr:hypothetical protein [Fortiea contorta]